MSCVEFEELAALQVEGDLPERQAPRLAQHVSGCAACRAALEELRESQAALKCWGEEETDAIALARVRQRILAGLQSAPAPRRRWPLWAAAAACAALVTGAILWRQPQAPPAAPPKVAPQLPQPPVLAAAPHRPHRVRRRTRPAPAPSAANAEPLLIKLLTDDPDVVIYWIVEGKAKGD